MMIKTARRLTTLCLSSVLTFGMSGLAHGAANDAALKALFDQANYWHEKSHDDLAMESLRKVLMVDANNTQAMYLMAYGRSKMAICKSHPSGARVWRKFPLMIRGYRHSIMPNS